jgi:hypothetical protein
MPQQKGMKRAEKVADRKKKKTALAKTASIRKAVRQVEAAEQEAQAAAAAASKKKKK